MTKFSEKQNMDSQYDVVEFIIPLLMNLTLHANYPNKKTLLDIRLARHVYAVKNLSLNANTKQNNKIAHYYPIIHFQRG